MGKAAPSHLASVDVLATDAHPRSEPAVATELDVDDVRLLLKELRLRRQLRAQD